jgi:hypothetical protein
MWLDVYFRCHRCFSLTRMFILRGSCSLLVWAVTVLVAIAIVLSLWMPVRVFKSESWQPHPSLQSNPSSNLNLSDVFSLLPDPPGVDPIALENSKMLHALVACVEHKNCHQNQTKGASNLHASLFTIETSFIRLVIILASSYFRDYLLESRGGESIWYEFLFHFSFYGYLM